MSKPEPTKLIDLFTPDNAAGDGDPDQQRGGAVMSVKPRQTANERRTADAARRGAYKQREQAHPLGLGYKHPMAESARVEHLCGDDYRAGREKSTPGMDVYRVLFMVAENPDGRADAPGGDYNNYWFLFSNEAGRTETEQVLIRRIRWCPWCGVDLNDDLPAFYRYGVEQDAFDAFITKYGEGAIADLSERGITVRRFLEFQE